MKIKETPQLRELRACQNKIRKMKHELRCIGEAHQRVLYTLADSLRSVESFRKQRDDLRTAYQKAVGVGPGWIKRTIRDIANILFNIAR